MTGLMITSSALRCHRKLLTSLIYEATATIHSSTLDVGVLRGPCVTGSTFYAHCDVSKKRLPMGKGNKGKETCDQEGVREIQRRDRHLKSHCFSKFLRKTLYTTVLVPTVWNTYPLRLEGNMVILWFNMFPAWSLAPWTALECSGRVRR